MCANSLTISPCSDSHHRGVPVREHDRAHVQRAARLELRLHVLEQHHVRRPLRRLARALPHQGPRDGQRDRRVRQPRLRHHGACSLTPVSRDADGPLGFGFGMHSGWLSTSKGPDYSAVRRPVDLCADIRVWGTVHRLGAHRAAAAVRAQREGVHLIVLVLLTQK